MQFHMHRKSLKQVVNYSSCKVIQYHLSLLRISTLHVIQVNDFVFFYSEVSNKRTAVYAYSISKKILLLNTCTLINF